MRRTINIALRNTTSRYVALDLKNQGTIIAEGRTAMSVVQKARKTGREFSMMFIPQRGKTYVF